MSNSRTKRAINGSFSGILHHFFFVLFQLIITPLILLKLGQGVLGSYAIILQIIGYGIVFDFGFSTSLNRLLAQEYNSKKNYQKFISILQTGKRILYLLNSFTALIFLLVAFNFDNIFSNDVELNNSIKYSLIIISIWTILRTPIYIFNFALNSSQDLSTINILNIVSTLFRLILTIFSIYKGYGLVGIIFSNVFAELLYGLLQRIVFYKFYPHFKKLNPKFNKDIAKKIWSFGIKYWGVNLSGVLFLGTDNIIIGAVFGASVASIFFTSKMFASLIITIISKIIDQTYPALNQISKQEGYDYFKIRIVNMYRYLLLLVLPSCLAIIIFLESIIIFWVGAEQYGGSLLSIALSMYVFIQVNFHLTGITILVIGNLGYWSIISVLSGFFGVLIAYYLSNFGLAFVTISMSLSMLPPLIYLLNRMIKYLKLSKNEIFKILIRPVMCSIPLLFLLFFYQLYGNPNYIINSILWAMIYTSLVMIFTWRVGLIEIERTNIKKYIFSLQIFKL